jgi:uncharacterized membrane protein
VAAGFASLLTLGTVSEPGASPAAAIAQVAWAFLMPMGMLWLARRIAWIRKVGPVILCYALGMAYGNQPFLPVNLDLAMKVCTATVMLSIPLMLYSLDFTAWFRLAGKTILSFSICVVTALAAAAAAHFLFGSQVPESAKMAGMLASVYIGGTPNLNAVGLMVGAAPDTFVLANTADMVLSTTYLILMLTAAPALLARVLPRYPYKEGEGPRHDWDPLLENGLPPWRDLAGGLLLTLGIAALGGAVALRLPPSARDGFAILVITTLAIGLSFSPKVRAIKGTQFVGQYFMTVFFAVLGSTADLAKLFTSSPMVFVYTAVALYGAVFAHFLLCWAFKIDRDTTMITSMATIFSPPFVPPMAVALKNPDVLAPGIACGLMGYAVANYAGWALVWLLS